MIHKTAEVSRKSKIGRDVQIWAFSIVRENAKIGDECIIGSHVYIDHDAEIGCRVKIQNNALVYFGSKIDDDVFIGPGVILTNDKYPRSTNKFGQLKNQKDWQVGEIRVGQGASIGAGCVITPGVRIGKYALIGAGSVVTKSIPDFGLVWGNPARLHGFVCQNGHPFKSAGHSFHGKKFFCAQCAKTYKIK